MAGLVLEYYWLLRSVLRSHSKRRRCRCRCRHCGIFFITDPRNAGRRDLRCPFGCRKAHARQASTRRSVAYYGSAEGKFKKRLLNSKRPRRPPREDRPAPPETSEAPKVADAPSAEPPPLPPPPPPPPQEAQSRSSGRWSLPLVEHVRLLCSLIEGRRVRRDEVLLMLGEVLRQHSMARRRKVDHLVARLHQRPP